MTGVYLFATAAGVPLLAWFLLQGGDDGGGDSAGGIGGVMLRLLPLSTIAIIFSTFGVCGLVAGAAGATDTTALLAASVAAVIAGVLNTTAFAYLRRSESGATVDEARLTGAFGRVVLPVTPDHRGRIAVDSGGQQIYLSALAYDDGPEGQPLEIGAPVLVVEVRNGIARVARLDGELADPDYERGQ